MNELDRLNQHPWSQQAKQALLALNEKPEPELLYLLQLVEVAVNRPALVRMLKDDRADLKEAMDPLMGAPPDNVWKMLTTPDPDSEDVLLPPEPELSPLDMAAWWAKTLLLGLRAHQILPSRTLR